MQDLKSILANKQLVITKGKRPLNLTFEEACQFGEYVGINIFVVMKLFKLYGKEKVLSLRSWLYDCPFDSKKGGKIALAHWKLKELGKNTPLV